MFALSVPPCDNTPTQDTSPVAELRRRARAGDALSKPDLGDGIESLLPMAIASAILWLRRIAFCFFFTLAILFAALWVRSYFYLDSVIWTTDGPVSKAETVLRNLSGTVILMQFTEEKNLVREFLQSGPTRSVFMERTPYAVKSPQWSTYNIDIAWAKVHSQSNIGFWRFAWSAQTHHRSGDRRVQFPLWFATVTSAVLAIVLRPAPRFKFSLRDLLTLTTVAALTIGPLTFWLRSIG